MENGRTVLVLGATGGVGSEVARRLAARGWTVRALHRSGRPEGADPAFEWLKGDAMDAASVRAAAEGVSVIVHAVNPPGYRRWAELVLPMVDNTVAAAEAVGARVLLPGTVYNYGPDAFPLLREDDAQRAESKKGKIRVEMERRLEASVARGARVLIVRAGDYFGPNAASNWFAGGMISPGGPVRVVFNPGGDGVGHSWAYLPDVAETMVRLLEREGSLPDFARFHFEGHVDVDGSRMAATIAAVAGTRPWMMRFPWWIAPIAWPMMPVLWELWEMRYLWRTEMMLDGTKLRAELGEVPFTPWEEAVRVTLAGQGCLPDGHGAEAAVRAS